jgi:hypothetical protein
MTADGDPLPVVGGRFLLVEQLAADDDHEVWRGHDDLASRPVVVKRFLGSDQDWRHSFRQRSARLMALSDPGVASVLGYDADDEPAWLALAEVEGDTVARIQGEGPLSDDDALAVVGQAGLALAGAHAAGVGHGRLDARHVMVRTDGSVALIGLAPSSHPDPAPDLAALATMARELLGGSGRADVQEFLAELDRLRDAAEIGRTALALATSIRADPAELSSAVLPDHEAQRTPASAPEPAGYDDAERRRVRNRLIALGAIVVVGGAILLFMFGRGGGQTTVPDVVGLPYVQALHELNSEGLRGDETVTTGPIGSLGLVRAQYPPGGERVKIGSLVELTVVTSGTQ